MPSLDSARTCAGCGKPLSRYNDEDRCQACISSRRTGDAGNPPDDAQADQLPAARRLSEVRGSEGQRIPGSMLRIGPRAWEVEARERAAEADAASPGTSGETPGDMWAAFFAELDRLMSEGDVGVRQLARRTNYDPSHISMIRNRRRSPSLRAVELIDKALGAGGRLAASAPSRREIDRARANRSARRGVKVSELAASSAPAVAREDILSSSRRASPAIAELCGALTDYDFSLGRFGSLQHDEIPSLGNLERDLRIAFDAYQQSRFTSAAIRASSLLADAQLAVRESAESERADLLKVLAFAYHVAAVVLGKSGESDLALVAADRGLNVAERSGSVHARGSLIRSVAFTLLSAGRLEPAMRLVESGAASIESEISRDDTVLSLYGMLFLAGSMAASRFGDGSKTADYLSEAGNAARHLGKDANHLWTAFGPANVAIHRVNTAAELGDIQTVLDSGLSLNAATIPAERRVRYLLDVARAYSLSDNRDDALSTMLNAERIAPEQVRQHHVSRKVVINLVRNTTGKPGVELARLAERVNVRELI